MEKPCKSICNPNPYAMPQQLLQLLGEELKIKGKRDILLKQKSAFIIYSYKFSGPAQVKATRPALVQQVLLI